MLQTSILDAKWTPTGQLGRDLIAYIILHPKIRLSFTLHIASKQKNATVKNQNQDPFLYNSSPGFGLIHNFCMSWSHSIFQHIHCQIKSWKYVQKIVLLPTDSETRLSYKAKKKEARRLKDPLNGNFKNNFPSDWWRQKYML